MKPLLKNEQNDAKLRETAKSRVFKMPIFILLLVLVINLFGPLIIYFNFLFQGRVQVVHYVLCEAVIFITTAIFSTLMYFILHHITFEFLYESDLLTQEEKEKELPMFVDRKMIIVMNGFSTFAPILIILLAIELYNVNKPVDQTEIPIAMFAMISIVAGLTIVIVQNILSNQWYEKLKQLDALKHNDKELDFGDKLSTKEISVVKLLVKGYSNQEIGGSLYMSVPAVKKCLSNIYDKLDVKSRSQLIAKFIDKA
jgi:DNA-binding CsgD family transcriptional regulator